MVETKTYNSETNCAGEPYINSNVAMVYLRILTFCFFFCLMTQPLAHEGFSPL